MSCQTALSSIHAWNSTAGLHPVSRLFQCTVCQLLTPSPPNKAFPGAGSQGTRFHMVPYHKKSLVKPSDVEGSHFFPCRLVDCQRVLGQHSCSFHSRYPYPPHGWLFKILRWGGGNQMPKICKGKYVAKLEFSGRVRLGDGVGGSD